MISFLSINTVALISELLNLTLMGKLTESQHYPFHLLTEEPCGFLRVKHQTVDRDALLVHRSPLVEADLVLGMEHADLPSDAAGHQHVAPLAAQHQCCPGKSVEVLSEKKNQGRRQIKTSHHF